MVVLITGSNGQVGQAFKSLFDKYQTIRFVFCNSRELDITDMVSCVRAIEIHKPDVVINLAAYTAVDLAELEVEKAFLINAEGVKNIAVVCKEKNIQLVHISTDFVFDGLKNSPYNEQDIPNPLNIYGASKLKGEKYVQEILTNYYIVRTSWVYSDFGHNFKNTILRLAETETKIRVVNDQVGCPTSACELAEGILKMLQIQPECGLYHFRGESCCSWFEFAENILKETQLKIRLISIPSSEFSTQAIRPKYSVMDMSRWHCKVLIGK